MPSSYEAWVQQFPELADSIPRPQRSDKQRTEPRETRTANPRRTSTPGRMNKTEARYAQELELQKRSGQIRDWRFESFKLRLANRTWYTPDFLVIENSGAMRFDETKGHWEDDARVKIKVAAEQFPEFQFRALRWRKGDWSIETF